jgi:anthranilate/para-aminobenzoate synthase component I
MPADALPWRCTPLQAMARWPAEVPLAALVSGDEGPWSRWSVLAVPGAWQSLPHDADADAAKSWLAALERTARGEATLPGDGGWLLQLSYELGAVFEPATHAVPREADPWPLAQAARIETAAVHDARTNRWFRVGGGSAHWPRIEAAIAAAETGGAFELDAPTPCTSDAHYAELVARTVDLIRAGDLFQANIARGWHAKGRGDARAFGLAALQASQARYGAWLETPAGHIASMSPELFLHVDRERRVVTRPIKGTRPAGADTREFLRSAKDAAELHMIVDLMRNDLARACRAGSVRVRQARAAEPHATVLHGVAEVEGGLRTEADLADLLAATFPPGSITGAPKVRAMQVIRELEAFDRGPYCGAIGLLGADGTLSLNVAIRTAVLRGSSASWQMRYAAGCGIVSDSDPAEEVRETHAKAAVLLRAAAHARQATDSNAHALSAAASASPAPAAPGA